MTFRFFVKLNLLAKGNFSDREYFVKIHFDINLLDNNFQCICQNHKRIDQRLGSSYPSNLSENKNKIIITLSTANNLGFYPIFYFKR